jgi:hypothetical protein
VRDRHPGSLAVGRHEQLEAALELGVVERLRRQVERIVVLGIVEGLAERGGVLQRFSALCQSAADGGVIRLQQCAIGLLDVDLRWDQRQHLRLQRVEFVEACSDLAELVTEFGDAVE